MGLEHTLPTWAVGSALKFEACVSCFYGLNCVTLIPMWNFQPRGLHLEPGLDENGYCPCASLQHRVCRHMSAGPEKRLQKAACRHPTLGISLQTARNHLLLWTHPVSGVSSWWPRQMETPRCLGSTHLLFLLVCKDAGRCVQEAGLDTSYHL